MTLEELKQYDGKEGRPAYIAYKGKIYDLSKSDFWAGGIHMGIIKAGEDVTEKIGLSPHGEVNIFRYPAIAELEGKSVASATMPAKLSEEQEKMVRYQKLYKKYHPHPIMVHFPMGIIPFAFFAQIIGFICPLEIYFTFASVVAMMIGTVFIIPAMATGTVSYIVNYNKTANIYLKRKIRLSSLALAVGIITSIYGYIYIDRMITPEAFIGFSCPFYSCGAWSYTILTAIMTGLVIAIGYNGGKMTWPDDKK